jgi:hypothetical protein
MTEAPQTPDAPLAQAVDNDAQAAQELSKPEDATAYIEDRQEQEKAEASPQDAEPQQQRRASRYERLKRARDAAQAEAAELRKRLDPESPTPPENPYQDEIEHGRREAEFSDQAEKIREYAETAGAYKARAEAFAKQFPDFEEAIESVNGVATLPPLMSELIAKSPYGPAMVYLLAKDAYEGQGIIFKLGEITDPLEQAREFGKFEQTMENIHKQAAQQPAQQQRVTQAPPPMRPISGGSAGAPKDLAALAASDDIGDYAKARRRQEHA